MSDDRARGRLADQVTRWRETRRSLEESVLPLATSLDGRRFEFQASLHGLELQAGGYAVLEDDTTRRLGQVIDVQRMQADGPQLGLGDADGTGRPDLVASVTLRAAHGTGVILDPEQGGAFHDVRIRPAQPDEVVAWLQRIRPNRAALRVGDLLLAPGVPLALDAGGFDRHSFLCGQSGSGKTYSLGLVLERLLVETRLRLVILDPNSDYVRLAETRASASPKLVERYRETARGIVVRRAGSADSPLRVRFGQLEPAARAALLRLDPIQHREEYALLSELFGGADQSGGRLQGMDDLLTTDCPEARQLSLRAANLGVGDWGLWPRGRGGSVVDDLDDADIRCLVVDLGSLPGPSEQAVVAEAVLAALWQRRDRREPVLVVVDEAHNVCPSDPADAVTALATEHAVRIAAEGRKFGLYLLVASQRPQKVESNVVSQCDNLLLMRMNSVADLGLIEQVFSYVPPSLLKRAVAFRQGEALVAGKIASHPCFVRFGNRFTEEGGADVPTEWATASRQPEVRHREGRPS